MSTIVATSMIIMRRFNIIKFEGVCLSESAFLKSLIILLKAKELLLLELMLLAATDILAVPAPSNEFVSLLLEPAPSA